MYNQIAANKRKSAFLVLFFILIVLTLGWLIGELTDSGYVAIAYAAVISLGMTLFSYFQGDRLALWSSGAREIKKEENLYLHRLVENLCITAGLPSPRIHIINDQVINAFATGRDPKHASIAVTTGAIEKLENEELEGVLAHELSHIKNYDIRVMMIVIVLVGTVSLLADMMLRAHLFGGQRNNRERGLHPIFLIIGLTLILLSPLIAELIRFAVSRKREYLADASGSLLTRYPEGLARALEKIRAHNRPMVRANHATAHLFLADPFARRAHKALTTLFSTHPPLDDRIRVLRSMTGS